MFARSGWICCENTSLVSQVGCSDSSHSEHACACRRRDATCLARASGLRAATRPSLAAPTRRSVAPPIARSAQLVRPTWMVLPHPRQRFSRRGGETGDGSGDPPFASRLRRCVNRVAGPGSPLATGFQNMRATDSATGATARPHIGAVSERRAQSDAIRRQFPSRCSKNHSRLTGSRVIQSSKNASTCGRTGSMRSQARLSRAFMWNQMEISSKPTSGPEP